MAAGGWSTSKEANHGSSLPGPMRTPIGRECCKIKGVNESPLDVKVRLLFSEHG